MAKKAAAKAKPLPISLQAEMPRGGQYCSHLVFSPDSERLVACSNDRKIHLYDVATNQRIACIQEHSSSIDAIAFSPDSERFATISQRASGRTVKGGELLICQAKDGKVLKRIAVGPDVEDIEFLSLFYTPNGKNLVGVTYDGRETYDDDETHVVIRDSSSGKIINRYPMLTISQIAMNPNGKRLVAAGSREVLVLDFPELLAIRHEIKLNGRVRAVAYSPDRKTVAAVDNDYTVHLFSAVTGRRLAKFSEPKLDVQHVQFSSDGKLLATIGVTMHGGSPAPIRIWDLNSKKLLAAFPGSTGVEKPSGFPGACALSDDFKLFANAGTKTRLWQVSF
jgi:WD40 repeat protein